MIRIVVLTFVLALVAPAAPLAGSDALNPPPCPPTVLQC